MSTLLAGILIGYILCLLSMGLSSVLIKLNRPRYVAPTKRRNRDRLPEVGDVPPMPVCKPARVDEAGGISYRWLGVTGHEE